MKFKISTAKKQDIKLIFQLAVFEFSKPPFNEKWNKKLLSEKLKNHFKHCKILIAKNQKELAGFIIFHTEFLFASKTGAVDEFVVAEKFREIGLGTKLLKEFEKYCRKNKTKMSALLASRVSRAFKFYKKRKYKESGWALLTKKL